MAEYITKKQALETECEKCPVNKFRCSIKSVPIYDCLFHCNSYNAINNLPNADVVERAEYERVLKENECLRGDLEFKSEALNSIGQMHKDYVSKIDKAINKLKQYSEILKRNIGE